MLLYIMACVRLPADAEQLPLPLGIFFEQNSYASDLVHKVQQKAKYHWKHSQKVTGPYEPAMFVEALIANGQITKVGNEVHWFDLTTCALVARFKHFKRVKLNCHLNHQLKKLKRPKSSLRYGPKMGQ